MWLILAIFTASLLAYNNVSRIVWAIAFGLYFVFLSAFSQLGFVSLSILWGFFLSVSALLNITFLRVNFMTKPLFNKMKKITPKMSETERVALESGTVSWDRELFSGNPNWDELLNYPAPKLTEEEQAFMDGPVNELCSMINDWEITHHELGLPKKMWAFLKEKGFFSLIIAKKYGGKEFSAYAHSAILIKIYSMSTSVGTTVSVPNSLGPAELLQHYGTEEQKNYYLPRLAKGDEIPCFALTSAHAGSDASSLIDRGVVCKDKFEGKEVVGIRLNWDKRYITLAPVATVLGLAFKLFDPDHFIGSKKEIGITCALIPVSTKGITIGRRHFPLNAAFANGPTQGKDVFIPLDWIIGGVEMAGEGWRMLMESLGAGRGISLPSGAAGGTEMGALSAGAYARIRRQFNTSIGQFEGIQAPLARIAGNTYVIDAAIRLVTSLIDCGEKPAVVSAIVKYHTTELSRQVANDVMDIHGGKAICLGKRNYTARAYQAIPIGITVEGANILTRNLIIFGQGAIRCHPYIVDELAALQNNDVDSFDKLFSSHFAHIGSNKNRSFIHALTRSFFVNAPKGELSIYFKAFTRFSSALSFATESAFIVLGASLKRRERLSARLGDILSLLYLGSAVLKRYIDEGSHESDLPLVHWTCQELLYKIQQSFSEIIDNFPNRFFSLSIRIVTFPLGKHFKQPSDALSHQVAELLLSPSATRDRLTAHAYKNATENNSVGKMEAALADIIAVEPIDKKIIKATQEGQINGFDYGERVDNAIIAGVINQEEADFAKKIYQLRMDLIAVDDFAENELK